MTGIVTAAWMPSIIAGSLMRATPPSRRMSAGTRSSAMTATAPASSAILACSAVTTSMMTPPRNISARPRLTRAVPVVRVRQPSVGESTDPAAPRSAQARIPRDRSVGVVLRGGGGGGDGHDGTVSPCGTSSHPRDAGRELDRLARARRRTRRVSVLRRRIHLPFTTLPSEKTHASPSPTVTPFARRPAPGSW